MGIRNRQVAIAVGVILVAVVYVVITGMRDTMVYYYTVSEVAAQQGQGQQGQRKHGPSDARRGPTRAGEPRQRMSQGGGLHQRALP